MAYVLGFLFADGNVTDSAQSSRTRYVQFSNTNRQIIEEIRKIMRSSHKIQIRRPQIVEYPGGKIYKNSRLYRFRIGSKELFSDVYVLGVIPNKSLVVKFPKVEERYLSHFVRGYFDGDGCVYVESIQGKTGKRLIKRMRVIFTSGSKRFLVGLEKSLSKISKISGGNIYHENRAFRLVYGTKSSNLLCNFMYKNKGNLFLGYKYDTFNRFKRVRQISNTVIN